MGLLVEGQWKDEWYKNKDGKFIRPETAFRHRVDGQKFSAEPDRYHLYVSYACPWAHRTLIARKIKGLEESIDCSVVHPHMAENGWTFQQDKYATGDKLYSHTFLHQLYTTAKRDYTGRVTVPVLWDKKEETIVNNESAEILRILNSDFQELSNSDVDLYPAKFTSRIDEINEMVYNQINNGVYKTGFATTQKAYEEAYDRLFNGLDRVEKILSENSFLAGEFLTEADWRLFTTIYRFDAVYYGHFKCNKKRIEDYPNLSNYLRQLYQEPGISETCNMDHIKWHYYHSHLNINPTGVVPKGPELDYSRRHNRGEVRYFS